MLTGSKIREKKKETFHSILRLLTQGVISEVFPEKTDNFKARSFPGKTPSRPSRSRGISDLKI